MRIISYLIFFIILLVGISFAILNPQLVVINYYLGTSKLALPLLLVIVLGIGGFIGWFVGLILWFGAKRENLRLSQRIKMLEKEVSNLRVAPLNEIQ